VEMEARRISRIRVEPVEAEKAGDSASRSAQD